MPGITHKIDLCSVILDCLYRHEFWIFECPDLQ